MEISSQSVSVKGKDKLVPCLRTEGATIIVSGTALRTASIFDEEWLEDQQLAEPLKLLEALKKSPLKADLFTFTQRIPDIEPRYPFKTEWDNSAAVKITTFQKWWDSLPQESRKNVRRGEKRGVTSRVVPFDDAFVSGIKSIYDESPARQGRAFWHYGKSLEEVKRANSTYLDRSEFVAAYLGEELIGFIKMVYVGKVARIMQIISKNAHADKRTPNILLTKAVEVCCQREMTHFIYGQYFYGKKGHTPITEFKRRNGFEHIKNPRYFIPLTTKGKVALATKLHLGAKNLIPAPLANFLLETRAKIYARRAPNTTPSDSTTSVEEKSSKGAAKE